MTYSPFSAVVFDFGDTLFHSPSGAAVLVEAGLGPERAALLWDEIWEASKTAEELARGRDLSEQRHREAWLDLFGRVEPHAPGLAPVLYERVMQHDRWLPYPDAGPVLAELHARGVRVGVLSNIPGPLRPLFERHGFAGHVAAYVESHEQGRVKPDLELFRTACRQLRAAPSEALMVGDSHVADGAAVLAGMAALLLPAVAPGTERGLRRVLALCS